MPPSPAPDLLLELHDIGHRYARKDTFSGFNMRLARGQIGCLLGPSGCGKTTVLRCIAGFEPLSDGEIRLDGQSVSRPGFSVPTERRHIGMVFQDYALFPHLDVRANVGFGLRGLPAAARNRRVQDLLEVVGLAGLGSVFPHALSGGQQQRVALARALAPQPALLLMDEPFSNLDVELRERLGLEVRAILKQQNMTAILVTHDQHEAFAIADEIGVMHCGQIQQWAPPYRLYHEPANRFVAGFVGEGVLLAGRVLADGRIAIELGDVRPRIASTSQPGDSIDVLIRPDDILHDDAAPTQATVVAKAFRGAEFLYTLRLAGGAEVLSLVPSHHNHAIGERIGIRLEIDHVVAFPVIRSESPSLVAG